MLTIGSALILLSGVSMVAKWNWPLTVNSSNHPLMVSLSNHSLMVV